MKIIELFDSGTTNIFRSIQSNIGLEWFTTDFADILNLEYFLGHSGNKTTSLLVDRLIISEGLMVDDQGHVVTDDDGDYVISDVSGGTYQEDLAKIIIANYKRKWDVFYKSLSESYDPSAEETETTVYTPNVTATAESYAGSQSKTVAEDKGSEQKTQGFNSTDYSPVSKSSGTVETTSTADYDSNHSKTTSSYEGSNTNTVTRTGGDYSDRVEKRLELMRTNLMEVIIHDVDRILTLPYYEQD